MRKTIDDAYAAQDASDMFFANANVTEAYAKACAETESLGTDDACAAAFVDNLREHSGEYAEAIAADFLRRV